MRAEYHWFSVLLVAISAIQGSSLGVVVLSLTSLTLCTRLGGLVAATQGLHEWGGGGVTESLPSCYPCYICT